MSKEFQVSEYFSNYMYNGLNIANEPQPTLESRLQKEAVRRRQLGLLHFDQPEVDLHMKAWDSAWPTSAQHDEHGLHLKMQNGGTANIQRDKVSISSDSDDATIRALVLHAKNNWNNTLKPDPNNRNEEQLAKVWAHCRLHGVKFAWEPSPEVASTLKMHHYISTIGAQEARIQETGQYPGYGEDGLTYRPPSNRPIALDRGPGTQNNEPPSDGPKSQGAVRVAENDASSDLLRDFVTPKIKAAAPKPAGTKSGQGLELSPVGTQRPSRGISLSDNDPLKDLSMVRPLSIRAGLPAMKIAQAQAPVPKRGGLTEDFVTPQTRQNVAMARTQAPSRSMGMSLSM